MTRTIESLFIKLVEDIPNPRQRGWLDAELDRLQNSGTTMILNDDIGVITVSNHRGGISASEALNDMFALATLTKRTVVSSLNGHFVTITGKSRHD